MGRTAKRKRVERPRDIRFGADAAHFLVVRRLLQGWARFAALVAMDVAALSCGAAAVSWAGAGGWWRSLPLLVYPAVLAVTAAGGYGPGEGWRRYGRIGAAALVGWMTAVGLIRWEAPRSDPGELAAAGLAGTILLVGLRFLGASVVRVAKRRGWLRWRIVAVGDADSTAALGSRIGDAQLLSVIVAGAGAGEDAAPDAARVQGELLDALTRSRVDAVIVTNTLERRTLEVVLGTSFQHGVPVHLVPVSLADVPCKLRPNVLLGCAAMEAAPARHPVPPMTAKRVLDVVIAGAALVLLSPVMALIALAIKLDSPGPVFFGQIRAGVGGHPFRMWKFRTMHRDADRWKHRVAYLNGSGDPRLFKVVEDPRVTRVGRWLRRTSLDELPQLFNVLRGEMSLVGPRPFFPEDLALYEPHHFERLSVLPGITGLWQVSGRSEIRDFDAVVKLDREYIRRWSLGLDMEILLKTIPAVIRRDGAY